jgi:hypothetical protein
MKNRLKLLASMSIVGLQAQPALVHIALAQEMQTITVTGSLWSPPPSFPSGGYAGGGLGGSSQSNVPEGEAFANANAPSPQQQAAQIAKGVVMVCPNPGEPFNPGYYQRAIEDCRRQVSTALGAVSNPTITLAACGAQASRIQLAYQGLDQCR